MSKMMSLAELAKELEGKTKARCRVKHEPGRMNKLEARYERECLFGKAASWKFEAVKFRLADNTFYTPDFFVVGVDGQAEVHEVKGFWEDDARVKIKVFAEMYPEFVVKAACLEKKQWKVETFNQ